MDPLEESIARHARFVRAVAARIVGPDDADDVAQETALAALRARPDAGRGLHGWLAAVARNFAYRFRRDSARRRRREEAAARPEPAPSAHDGTERARLLRSLMDAVLSLDEPYRSAVIQRWYEGLAPAEIARRSGVSPGAIRTRLHRAIAELRRTLDRVHGSDRQWMSILAPIAGGAVVAAAALAAGATAVLAGAAPAAAGATSLLGGIIVGKTLAAAGLVAATLTAAWFFLSPDQDTADPPPPPPAHAGTEEPALPDAPAHAATPRRDAVSPAGAGATPMPARRIGEAAGAPAEGLPETMSETAAIAGRVVDEDGRPVADVPVTLDPTEADSVAFEARPSAPTKSRSARSASDAREAGGAVRPRETTTDREGRFRFGGLPPRGAFVVRARPERLCDVTKSVAVSKPGLHDAGDLVALIGGVIVGRVRDPDGMGVGAARIRARRLDQAAGAIPGVILLRGLGGEGRSAVSEPDGLYRIAGLEPGDWEIIASSDNHPTGRLSGVRVRKGHVTDGVDVRLDTGLTIEGSVRSADGAPIEGARVTAQPAVQDLFDENGGIVVTQRRSTLCDAEGKFIVRGLAAGAHELSARKAGFATETLTASAGAGSADFRLAPAGVIFGKVRSAAGGEPIASFALRTRRAGIPGDAPTGSSRVLAGAEAAEALGVPPSPDIFAILDCPRYAVSLVCDAPGFARFVSDPIEAGPEARTEHDIVLAPEITLEGMVLDPEGRPVPGASVTLRTDDVEAPGDAASGGDSGEDRTRRRRRSFGVPGGETLAEVGAGDRGEFRIGALNPGRYRLSASAAGFVGSEPRSLDLAPEGSIAGILLRLRRGGAISAAAADAEGRPLAGARVVAKPVHPGGTDGEPWTDPREAPRSAVTGPDGRCSIEALEPGTWAVTLREPSAGNTWASVVIEHSGKSEPGIHVRVESGKTVHVDLAEPPRGSIAGRVTEAGREVEGLFVSLLPDGDSIGFDAPRTRTDAGGGFAFRDVAPGRYTLSVRVEGAVLPTTAEVVVEGRQETRTSIAIPTGAIEGRVLSRIERRPLSGITVDVERAPEPGEGQPSVSRSVSAVMIAVSASEDDSDTVASFRTGPDVRPVVTDAEGRFRLRYLPEGRFVVTAAGGGIIRASSEPVRVVEGRTTPDVEVLAEAGGSVVARVESAAGLAFILGRLAPENDPSSEEVKGGAANRPLRFDGLRPGRYRLVVEADNRRGENLVEIRGAEAVETTVRLEER